MKKWPSLLLHKIKAPELSGNGERWRNGARHNGQAPWTRLQIRGLVHEIRDTGSGTKRESVAVAGTEENGYLRRGEL